MLHFDLEVDLSSVHPDMTGGEMKRIGVCIFDILRRQHPEISLLSHACIIVKPEQHANKFSLKAGLSDREILEIIEVSTLKPKMDLAVREMKTHWFHLICITWGKLEHAYYYVHLQLK